MTTMNIPSGTDYSAIYDALETIASSDLGRDPGLLPDVDNADVERVVNEFNDILRDPNYTNEEKHLLLQSLFHGTASQGVVETDEGALLRGTGAKTFGQLLAMTYAGTVVATAPNGAALQHEFDEALRELQAETGRQETSGFDECNRWQRNVNTAAWLAQEHAKIAAEQSTYADQAREAEAKGEDPPPPPVHQWIEITPADRAYFLHADDGASLEARIAFLNSVDAAVELINATLNNPNMTDTDRRAFLMRYLGDTSPQLNLSDGGKPIDDRKNAALMGKFIAAIVAHDQARIQDILSNANLWGPSDGNGAQHFAMFQESAAEWLKNNSIERPDMDAATSAAYNAIMEADRRARKAAAQNDKVPIRNLYSGVA